MGTWGLFVYFLRGSLCFSVCVSCPLIGWITPSLCLSAWLSPVSYAEEGLAGRRTHTHAHAHSHRHTSQSFGSPIEIRSLSKACIPTYHTLQRDKRSVWKERLLTELPPLVCVCVHASVYLFKGNTTARWIVTQVPLSLSLIDPNAGVGSWLPACLPASEHTNESITIHIYSYPQSFVECPLARFV